MYYVRRWQYVIMLLALGNMILLALIWCDLFPNPRIIDVIYNESLEDSPRTPSLRHERQ